MAARALCSCGAAARGASAGPSAATSSSHISAATCQDKACFSRNGGVISVNIPAQQPPDTFKDIITNSKQARVGGALSHPTHTYVSTRSIMPVCMLYRN